MHFTYAVYSVEKPETMHFTAATLLFIAAGTTAMGDDVCLPGGFKGGLTNAGCLDKGCWGMNSER